MTLEESREIIPLNGIHDWANRRTADPNGRNDSGNAEFGTY